MERYFHLRTFSAAALLDYTKTETDGTKTSKKIEIELDHRTRHPALLKTDRHASCALYDQLIEELELPQEHDPDCLRDILVYLDFSDVPFVPKKHKPGDVQRVENGKFLLENGFSIHYTGENTSYTIRYVAFEKSASMARESKITFLADAITKDDTKINGLLTRMDTRLSLGICPKKVAISKWYAYRGLYLSTAKRIGTDPVPSAENGTGTEKEPFLLNETTVIVLKEHIYNPKNKHERKTNILTAKKNGRKWELLEKEVIPDFKSFDGEGIIDPVYAEILNKKLGYTDKKAHSFQVRMPFTKGVLHEVDFHKFFKNEFLDGKNDPEDAAKTYASLKVTDLFGIERNLAEARIIIPASMFKADKWVETLRAKTSSRKKQDPMKIFFQKMEEYHHTLYVGNDDTLYSTGNGWTKLNYQFLNPADIDPEKLEEMVNTHLEHAREVLLSPTTSENAETIAEQTNSGKNEDDTAQTVQNEDGQIPAEVQEGLSEDRKIVRHAAWQEVLSKHPHFIHDPYIRQKLNATYEYAQRDIIHGRFYVPGECRFLSRDLLVFLTHIAENTTRDDIAQKAKIMSGTEKDPVTGKYQPQLLPFDRFYMPSAKMKLKWNKEYVLLRNPHLSRNEEVLLKSAILNDQPLHREYFSHLSGVTMIPLGSWAADALGGADFDGDLVKVVDCEPLTDAVRKTVYEAKIPNRTLPVIQIPSPASNMSKTPQANRINYQTIKNTFSQRIGYISNLAIRWAKLEYGTAAEAEEAEDIKDKTPYCTILVGLEVDSAKTGKHPDLSGIERSEWKRQKDDYLETLTAFKENSSRRIQTVRTEKSPYTVSFGGKHKISFDAAGTDKPTVDRLATLFAEKYKKTVPISDKRKTSQRFSFQNSNAWRKSLNPAHANDIQSIIEAYYAVFENDSLYRRQTEKYENRKYYGAIVNIQKLRHMGEAVSDTAMLGLSSEQEQSVNRAFAAVDRLLPDAESLNNALQTMINLKWAYTQSDKRDASLQEILPKPKTMTQAEYDSAITQLALAKDFSHTGYNILYFLIKDTLADRLQNESVTYQKTENPYLDAYMAIRETAHKEKQTPDIWHEELQDKCRKDLMMVFADSKHKELYEELMTCLSKKVRDDARIDELRKQLEPLEADCIQKALPYAYAHVGTAKNFSADKNGRFFWEIFHADEILQAAEEHTPKQQVNDRQTTKSLTIDTNTHGHTAVVQPNREEVELDA